MEFVLAISISQRKKIEDESIGFITWKDDQTNHVVRPLSDEKFTFSPRDKYVGNYE